LTEENVRIVKWKTRSYEKRRGMPMTTMETSRLLADAKWAFPKSDFVASVQKQFKKKGFITSKQEAALENVIDKGNGR
jgi:hypothetical protein